MSVTLNHNECQQVLSGQLSAELVAKLQQVEPENEFLAAVRDALDLSEFSYEEFDDDLCGWSPEEETVKLEGDKLSVSVLWEHFDRRGGNQLLETTVVVDGDRVLVGGVAVTKDVRTVCEKVVEATFWNGC